MSIAKGSDELWVGVKCQANPEIAGSPRNAFRCSPRWGAPEVARWIGEGASRLPTRTKRRMPQTTVMALP